ncbi:MAG: hypothetical protein JJT88_06530 [Gammaproteobacteria bacterium]|nr:hypothetical protein [Gammaproteobacteria bacterium]
MVILRRALLALAVCFSWGCGPRSYSERQLLDAYFLEGSTLSVHVGTESGTRTKIDRPGNPTGQRVESAVDRVALYRVDFNIAGNTATATGSTLLLSQQGQPLASAITMAEAFLALEAPPPPDPREIQLLAPQGNRFCVITDNRYTVYADPGRREEIDGGELIEMGRLRFTWSGERLYGVHRNQHDGEADLHRVSSTVVGSGGVWEDHVYDAGRLPLSDWPGTTEISAFDLIDDEAVFLLQKYPDPQDRDRRAIHGLVRAERVVATWTGDPPGWIRPDLNAVVGWHRRFNSLQGTLSLRSLHDGSERSIGVDATRALP